MNEWTETVLPTHFELESVDG